MQEATDKADPVTEIQASILEYLDQHPQASDSVEGIRNWWLFRRMARLSLQRVQQALDELERAELILRVVLRDGSVSYRKPGGDDARPVNQGVRVSSR